ncbi:hypothetical protein CC2G_008330 [Coprinopsis cinerea AmutBmut pab1-1]|nr:hypothetical protein CC2G_008330 [Coprinopsis cinerea AmutBmut pab1-1]
MAQSNAMGVLLALLQNPNISPVSDLLTKDTTLDCLTTHRVPDRHTKPTYAIDTKAVKVSNTTRSIAFTDRTR